MLQEKKFQPGALAVLAQDFRLTKQLRHAAYHRDRLLPTDESVQANAEMWIGGETASHTQRETDLVTMQTLSCDGSQTHIIDFGIRAPGTAASNGHLELARQIVKLGVAAQLPIQLGS